MTMSGTPYLAPEDKAEALGKSSAPANGAPEAVNRSQNDEPSQAQTISTQAQNQNMTDGPTDPTSRIDPANLTPQKKPDVVEKMQQMHDTGIIDSGAYSGERNDADSESPLGQIGPETDRDPKLSDE